MAVARIHIPVDADTYAAALEGLARVNEQILARERLSGGDIPPIYRSGVRYRREARDTWKAIPDVLDDMSGDCEDLSAWRVAELRVSGDDPNARVHVYRSGPRAYHAVVKRGDGTIEDPSRRLGMSTNREHAHAMRAYVRDNVDKQPIEGAPGAWVGIGEDPSPQIRTITFDLYRSGKGWAGIVRLPLARVPGEPPAAMFAHTTRTPPSDKAKRVTATKAVRLAAKIATNPYVKTMLPPGTAAAVEVLQGPMAKLATKQAGKILARLF